MPPRLKPPNDWWEEWQYRLPATAMFSLHALCGWGCHPARPESVSTCRNTEAAPGITSQQDGSGWLRSWARRSRPEPLCFLFLPMPLLEAGHRLPRGDMKEEETQ